MEISAYMIESRVIYLRRERFKAFSRIVRRRAIPIQMQFMALCEPPQVCDKCIRTHNKGARRPSTYRARA